MHNCTKIGELAARCGVSPDTVRFYEREGLLPPPRRTASGHRIYGDESFARLQFIRKLQGIGLTLQDIGEILALRDRNDPQAGEWIVKRLRARAEAIELELTKLRAFGRLLDEGIRLCEASDSSAFARLESLFDAGDS